MRPPLPEWNTQQRVAAATSMSKYPDRCGSCLWRFGWSGGKTTTAAAIAIEAAHLGRRAVVVTDHRAKRLADALGIAGLSNTPTRITGPWSGEVAAPSCSRTRRHLRRAGDHLCGNPRTSGRDHGQPLLPKHCWSVVGNSGIHGDRELLMSCQPQMSLIWLSSILRRLQRADFSEAPGRLARFLDHRLFRVVTAPTRNRSSSEFAAQPFSEASQRSWEEK